MQGTKIITIGLLFWLKKRKPAIWDHVDELGGHYAKLNKWTEVAQSCPTLCGPVDCILPGSSIHGILQARILEWVAISFSMGSSWPRDRTEVSHIAGRLALPSEPPGKP